MLFYTYTAKSNLNPEEKWATSHLSEIPKLNYSHKLKLISLRLTSEGYVHERTHTVVTYTPSSSSAPKTKSLLRLREPSAQEKKAHVTQRRIVKKSAY